MADYKQSSNCEAHTLVANDVVDLGNDHYRVWVNSAVGGTVEVAPGEAASAAGGEDRLYGTAATLVAGEWTFVSPEFPTRYVRAGSGGVLTVHATDASGRRVSRS
jgi:hypothetical protein